MTATYQLPEKRDNSWAACEARTFQPNPMQQMVVEAVQAALDSGLFYTDDVCVFSAKYLSLTADQISANFDNSRVEGGIFGMQAYYARRYIESRILHSKEDQAAASLKPVVGQKIGTIVFNDYKRNTGAFILAVQGLILKLQFKRGKNTYEAEVTALTLSYAIDRAFEKKLRKDNFALFTA